jgi:hypothetical protein
MAKHDTKATPRPDSVGSGDPPIDDPTPWIPNGDNPEWRVNRQGIYERDLLVEPDMVPIMLADAVNVRPFKSRVLGRYARDMADGRWNEGTAGTIDFNPDSQNTDGQHRLLAVQESGVPVWFRIRWGVPAEATIHTDEGVSRSFADYLRQNGYVDVHVLAATVSLSWRWERNRLESAEAATRAELITWLDAHPDIPEFLVGPRKATARPARMKRNVFAAVKYRASQLDAEDANRFFELVGDDIFDNRDNGAYRLRSWLSNNHPRRLEREMAFTVKGWNAWVTDTPVTLLTWKRGREQREAFPVMVNSNGDPYPPPFDKVP